MAVSSIQQLATTKEKKLKKNLKDKTSQFNMTDNFKILRDNKLVLTEALEFKILLICNHLKNHRCQSKTSQDLLIHTAVLIKEDQL